MWAVGVEVCFVYGEDVAQVPFVGDQCAVEEFVSASADPALDVCVRPWRVDWSEQHLDGLGCEDGVEGVGELGVSVSDQEVHLVNAVVQCHEEVAGWLECPVAGRVGGGAKDVYLAGGEFHGHHAVQASQQHGVDVEVTPGPVGRTLTGGKCGRRLSG